MEKEVINNSKETLWRLNREKIIGTSLETVKFALQEGEKRLNATIVIGEQLTSRGYTMLSIYTTILGVLIAFFASNLDKNILLETNPLVLIAILSLLPIAFCLVQIIILIFPYRMHYPGRNINELLSDEVIVLSNDIQMAALLVNASESIQYMIDFNEKLNKKRRKILKRIIIITTIVLFIILGTLLIMYLF